MASISIRPSALENAPKLTNFALSALFSNEHAAMSKRNEASAAEVASSETLARLHCLHSEISTHRLGNGVDVFTSFQALLGKQLDLGASTNALVSPCRVVSVTETACNSPVLEPDLNRSLCHVDLLSNSVSNTSGRGRVLVEFLFKSCELVLGRTLSLLVLLLLRQGALPGRTLRGIGSLCTRTGHGGRRRGRLGLHQRSRHGTVGGAGAGGLWCRGRSRERHGVLDIRSHCEKLNESIRLVNIRNFDNM